MVRLVELGAALVDLAVPLACASCGAAGAQVCRSCLRDAWAWCWPGGPRLVSPDPRPDGLPPVVACAVNDGAVRRLLHAYKDEDRRDARPVLRDLLVPGLRVAVSHLRGSGPADRVLVVPVPTSRAARRRRGDRPLEDLVRAAARSVPGCLPAPLLTTRGTALDQALLGSAARAHNLVGTMRLGERVRARDLAGRPVLLVDDLLTTGATLVEASRALAEAGVAPAAAVVVAATQRRPSG